MNCTEAELAGMSGRRVRPLDADDASLTVGAFYRKLARSAEFRADFTAYLAGLPYEAIYWETPPATDESLGRAFEFVALESESLALVQPDPVPFEEHFGSPDTIADFPNVGGDAWLVAPTPSLGGTGYPHLLAFLRHAPPEAVDSFWERAASVFRRVVSERPIWVSTAGLGVNWLHLRFDRRPKYYRFREYAAAVPHHGAADQ